MLVSNDGVRWSSGYVLAEDAVWPGPAARPPTGYLASQVPHRMEAVVVAKESLKPVITAAMRLALQRFAPQPHPRTHAVTPSSTAPPPACRQGAWPRNSAAFHRH